MHNQEMDAELRPSDDLSIATRTGQCEPAIGRLSVSISLGVSVVFHLFGFFFLSVFPRDRLETGNSTQTNERLNKQIHRQLIVVSHGGSGWPRALSTSLSASASSATPPPSHFLPLPPPSRTPLRNEMMNSVKEIKGESCPVVSDWASERHLGKWLKNWKLLSKNS